MVRLSCCGSRPELALWHCADGSGNVWVTNSGNNSVSEFIGLAAL